MSQKDKKSQKPAQGEPTPEENSQAQSDDFEFEEERELAALDGELDEIANAIDTQWSDHISQNISEELEELFYDDKKAFFDEIESQKEKFIEDRIRDKVEKKGALKQSLLGKHKQKAFDEFAKNHPDIPVEEVMDFYENELGARAKKEIDALPPIEALEKIASMMKPQEKEAPKEELPKQVDTGTSGNETQSDTNISPTSRY